MPLIRIQTSPGVRQIFIAGEGISDLATVELLPGERQVRMGSTGNEELAAGVARGTVVSGALVRVITQGILSGVKTALAVQAGDRLTIATSGVVTPLNTIQPTAVSGPIVLTIASGLLSGVASGLQGPLSGAVIIASGDPTGMAFNTAKVIGKALTSGLSGLGIQMLVGLG